MGNKIKECRKKRGVSQEELAKQIGVKRAVISKYETGKISPRLDMVQKIARALGVSIDELLGDTFLIGPARLFIQIIKAQDGLFYAASIPFQKRLQARCAVGQIRSVFLPVFPQLLCAVHFSKRPRI